MTALSQGKRADGYTRKKKKKKKKKNSPLFYNEPWKPIKFRSDGKELESKESKRIDLNALTG
jgi:hypothetical protein